MAYLPCEHALYGQDIQPPDMLHIKTFGKARIAHELGSHAFVIPFILGRDGSDCRPGPDVSILELLRVDYNSENIPESAESHSMRCAWFLVALFSKIRDEISTWEHHQNYLELSRTWKQYFWVHKTRILEDVRARTIDLISIDPWPTDGLRSQCKKQARLAAESLVALISRLAGGEPSTLQTIRLIISFDHAEVLAEAEYSMIILSHLFTHLPIMFLHITTRPMHGTISFTRTALPTVNYPFAALHEDSMFVPLPLDLPSGCLRRSIQEFLSGRRLWKAIFCTPTKYHDNVPIAESAPLYLQDWATTIDDRQKDVNNLSRLLGLTLVRPTPDYAVADELAMVEDSFPHIVSLTQEAPDSEETNSRTSRSRRTLLLQECVAHGMVLESAPEIALRLLLLNTQDHTSARLLADSSNCTSIPVRVLEFLTILFGERSLSTISSELVTELPTIGHVFPNAWIHFNHFIDSAPLKSKGNTIGAVVESALVQRAAVIDDHRIFIPVFSASSPERAISSSVLTTSAIIVSLGNDDRLTDDLYLESLPELFPHILVNITLTNEADAAVRLGTRRTGASGAFSYEIVARGSCSGIFHALGMEGETVAPIYQRLFGTT
ncbi:hypothetical protein VNI00_011812 [Paramarasmius palmivorus]|uniref:Uncharacterized protein n=1 Tax=Paramarasmius palmivorus TaxID=297713 RepID=A0AAW0CAJ9_9AGAR